MISRERMRVENNRGGKGEGRERKKYASTQPLFVRQSLLWWTEALIDALSDSTVQFLSPLCPSPPHPLVLYCFKNGDRHHHSVLCTFVILCRIVIIIFNRNKHEKLNIYHEVVFLFFTGFKVSIVRIEVRLASISLTCFLVVRDSTKHKSQPHPSSPLLPMPVFTMSFMHFTESESSECNLEEVMETLISELQCCTSQHSMDITDVIYMRIFYVKDVLDHWRAQDFIHVCFEKVTTSAPAVSLTPVDGLEKENTFMLVSCLLQRTKEEIQEWLSVNPSGSKRGQHKISLNNINT